MPMDEKEALLFGEMKAQIDRCFGRIEKLEHSQEILQEMVTTVGKLADEIKRSNARLGIVESDIKTLTGKNGQRWDMLVDKAIWLVVGALATWVLGHIGL